MLRIIRIPFYILEIFYVNYSFKFLLIKFDYILTFTFLGVEYNFIHPEKDEVVTKASFTFGSLRTILAKAIFPCTGNACSGHNCGVTFVVCHFVD